MCRQPEAPDMRSGVWLLLCVITDDAQQGCADTQVHHSTVLVPKQTRQRQGLSWQPENYPNGSQLQSHMGCKQHSRS